MGEEKKPIHGQIRTDKNGTTWVYVDENPMKEMTITPDSIRDEEINSLRKKLRKANILMWVLFFVGLVLGSLITSTLTIL